MKKTKRDITTLEAVLIVFVAILLTITIWLAYVWQSPKTNDSNLHGDYGYGETLEEAEKNAKPY